LATIGNRSEVSPVFGAVVFNASMLAEGVVKNHLSTRSQVEIIGNPTDLQVRYKSEGVNKNANHANHLTE